MTNGWQVVREGRIVGPIDLTDQELRQGLHIVPVGFPFTYRDYVDEYDRRARNRQASASFLLSIVAVVVAIVAIVLR